MNLTQNGRINQVTSETLIVGVDVGSQTHFCRAFDWRGFELSRRVFKFSNTGMGFLTFLRWTEELMNKTEMKKVIVGLGHKILDTKVEDVAEEKRGLCSFLKKK